MADKETISPSGLVILGMSSYMAMQRRSSSLIVALCSSDRWRGRLRRSDERHDLGPDAAPHPVPVFAGLSGFEPWRVLFRVLCGISGWIRLRRYRASLALALPLCIRLRGAAFEMPVWRLALTQVNARQSLLCSCAASSHGGEAREARR